MRSSFSSRSLHLAFGVMPGSFAPRLDCRQHHRQFETHVRAQHAAIEIPL